MLKVLGGVVVGIFVGALAFEILSRKHPGLIREIEDKAEEAARALLDSFSEGYRSRDTESKA